MTHKYIYVRREIYTKCSDKALKKHRTFGDMKKLFKRSTWIMLFSLIVAIISLIIFTFQSSKLCYLIPAALALIVPIIWELRCEKVYNTDARNQEIDEINDNYVEYIRSIKSVLTSCGIDSSEKIDSLKNECKARLNSTSTPYKEISSTVYNMLIGVPLGAIISAIMHNSANTAGITRIIELIMLGLIIIGFCHAVKAYIYYSNGYFKDQYLLDALNELDYSDF